MIELGKLKLKNPVMPASGTFGPELADIVNPETLGALVTRSVTLYPDDGPPPPRMLETASGLLTAIRVQSPGVAFFLKHELPYWKRFSVPLIVNIAGKTEEELLNIGESLQAENIAAIELNLASVNFPDNPSALDTLKNLIQKIKSSIHVPLIAKLSPFLPIAGQAKQAEAGGADILSLVHGFQGLSLDWRTRSPKLGDELAKLSGPAIKPLALAAVRQARQTTKIPIIGMGGIMSASDVLEFLAAGASAVAVGTATLVNPRALQEILEELKKNVSTGAVPTWSAG